MSDSTQITLEVIQETSNQFLEVVDGITERVAPLIDTIAEQLGVASEFVFETLIMQAYVTGVTYLVVYIIGGIILYNAVKLWKKSVEIPYIKDRYGDLKAWSDERYMVHTKAIITSALGGLSLICFAITIKTTVTVFFNPEFWALNYILDKL